MTTNALDIKSQGLLAAVGVFACQNMHVTAFENSVKIHAKLGKTSIPGYLDPKSKKIKIAFAKIMKNLNTRNHDPVNLNDPQTLLLAVSCGVFI